MPPPIPELQARLEEHADERTKEWWTRYLKGVAVFRGVKTPVIRREVHAWWKEHRGDELVHEQKLAITLELLRCEATEDSLAGMLLLQERLVPGGLEWKPALAGFAEVFDEGHLADWNRTDWMCVRVLGPLIERSPMACAVAVSAWRTAPGLWRRRASAVVFVNLAGSGEYTGPILAACDALVRDPERFSQSAVGWVLRELSPADRSAVESFLAEHADELSDQAVKMARGTHRSR